MLSALVIGIRDREARSQVELESLEEASSNRSEQSAVSTDAWDSHI